MERIMKLYLNGNSHTHLGDASLDSLFKELGINQAKVAILLNDEIIKRDTFGSIKLAENDKIEILTFAGGG